MRKLFLLLTLLTMFGVVKSQTTRTTVAPGPWSSPLTWDTGVPNTGDNVIINHSIFIDVKDTINDIVVNQTAFCFDTLFITGVLNLEADIFSSPIVLVNNDTHKGRLGQTTNGQIVGNFIWQKWISRCDGWGMYGGPFDVPLSEYGFFHTGFAGTSFPTFWCNTYYYDETLPNEPRDTGFYPPSGVTDILPRGQGFMLFDSSSSSTNAARVIEIEGTLDLSQDFNYNVTFSGNNNNPENGWCMVSNPYPGTIDWDAVGWTIQKTDNAIWVWDVCNRNYASYAGGIGVNGGTQYISSGQGFWVKANKPNPTLRSTREVISNQQQELRGGSVIDGLIRINLGDDEIALSINTDATNSYDSLYDAYKFLADGSRLYTYLDSTMYSINSILDQDTIPLWVKGDGVIDFNLTELLILPTIYYQDVQTGIVYDASTTPSYTFTSTTSDFYHRFNIITSQILSVEEINNQNNGEIINRINLMGQKVNENYRGVIIEIYSNGKTKKVVNTETF